MKNVPAVALVSFIAASGSAGAATVQVLSHTLPTLAYEGQTVYWNLNLRLNDASNEGTYISYLREFSSRTHTNVQEVSPYGRWAWRTCYYRYDCAVRFTGTQTNTYSGSSQFRWTDWSFNMATTFYDNVDENGASISSLGLEALIYDIDATSTSWAWQTDPQDVAFSLPAIQVINQAPAISGWLTNMAFRQGDTHLFSAYATDPGGSFDPLTYAWDLDGDGQYDDLLGSGGNFMFSKAGSFRASLQVTDDEGGVAKQSFTIDVAPVPLPATAWFFFSALAGFFGVKKLSRQSTS